MDWFTSDHHFFHKNIINLCNRPFNNIEEMHKILISNWNERVKNNDVVYHLGDFCLGGRTKALSILEKLNGIIRIIPGGHDEWQKSSIESGRIFIHPPLYTLEYKEKNLIFVLCHYPMRSWDRSNYGSYHLHGHSHGNIQELPNSVDVGVDCNDFYPINCDEIIENVTQLS